MSDRVIFLLKVTLGLLELWCRVLQLIVSDLKNGNTLVLAHNRKNIILKYIYIYIYIFHRQGVILCNKGGGMGYIQDLE